MKPKTSKTSHIQGGANFLVTINHTDNHSWQGSIQWLDTGERIHFRSALEMTSLIDQAVKQQMQAAATDTGERGKHVAQDRTWCQPLADAK